MGTYSFKTKFYFSVFQELLSSFFPYNQHTMQHNDSTFAYIMKIARIILTFFTIYSYRFFLVINFKIYFLSNFQIYNQFSLVAQLCPTFCKPMDYSMPGFPVHHQFLELSQTHINRISDAIQQSHSLSSLSLPAFNLSHLGSFPVSQLFPSGGQSIGVSALASVLPVNI